MIEIEERVKSFLAQHIDISNIDQETDMFKKGIVTSLYAMELVMFVEQEFGIRVENADLDLENFKSIKALVAFIQQKVE